ncbi:DUF4185 domain-containing protein [Gordonia sp. TBRC 11910]|uniref:DUF4185 domain-containing protein n=1 Tax=Gordonia asplenii TaxID=2725283 RepID=A0A848KZM6_9ACTN|nr:DUF4185 domain-containing protein [Gordonia asplenii]NMO01651.1 DUF4185 domain-containing protein [Gordonia asplenii]
MRLTRTAVAGLVTIGLALTTVTVVAPSAQASPCNATGLVGGDFGSTGSSGSSDIGLGSLDFGSYHAGGKKPQMPLVKLTSGPSQTVSWVTGPRSPAKTDARFSITSTDVGVPWDNGSGQVLMAFGDTWGRCQGAMVWRHNTMLRSNGDSDLSKGITFRDPQVGNIFSGASVTPAHPTFAQPMVNAVGVRNIEVGMIPTAGIAVNGVQYVSFMSIHNWGPPGRWVTNYSVLAASRDNGQHWAVDWNTARSNYELNIPGNSHFRTGQGRFQVSAFLRVGGWVYQYGTPNGRFGATFLSRVPASQIADIDAYEYYSGGVNGGWSRDSSTAGRVVREPVSEMSVAYNDYLKKYVMLSAIGLDVVLRTSPAPTGPWSNPRVIVSGAQTGGLYAPYIHPRSHGQMLYFVASRWEDYNVMLLRTDLSKVR